jgi:hypothetical protein
LNLTPQKLSQLRLLLSKAHQDYERSLDGLIESATDEMETVLATNPQDVQELVTEYVQDASQLSHDYYETVRSLWEQSAGVDFPDFNHSELLDPDRALWKVQGGFNNTSSPGLTFKQVKNGQSRSGFIVSDLWPRLNNPDDAMQFIADMIEMSARLTMQGDIKLDPTHPRWARVPKGANPCAFCVMLAGRGFAYRSEETASFGGSFHNGHCHCLVVPSWGGNKALSQAQQAWKDMYLAGKKHAGTSKPSDVAKAMRSLYPEDLRDGHYDLTAEWPDEVIYPYQSVWKHIFEGHGPNATLPNKTRFPENWSEKKIKYAVLETIADPEFVRTTADGLRESRYRMVDDQYIRAWLQKRRNTRGRFMVNTAHVTTDEEKERLWQRTSK